MGVMLEKLEANQAMASPVRSEPCQADIEAGPCTGQRGGLPLPKESFIRKHGAGLQAHATLPPPTPPRRPVIEAEVSGATSGRQQVER
mmetsp:Transcript_6859/g.16253  ORF Transcript_6859/g.16253 Transcript_6859/m.16253 type:complete len:88 (+) Transcript_6859:686-949(+)